MRTITVLGRHALMAVPCCVKGPTSPAACSLLLKLHYSLCMSVVHWQRAERRFCGACILCCNHLVMYHGIPGGPARCSRPNTIGSAVHTLCVPCRWYALHTQRLSESHFSCKHMVKERVHPNSIAPRPCPLRQANRTVNRVSRAY